MDYHKTAVAGACVIVCFLIAAVTALTALGRDVSAVVYLLGAIAAPTITGLLALNSTEKIRTTVDKVESNTNGNISAVLEHNVQLLELLKVQGVLPADFPLPEVPKLSDKPAAE